MADAVDIAKRFEPHESGAWFHGTRAGLAAGDLLTPGFRSNYLADHVSNHVYMTKVLDAAVLAAEMAVDDGLPRVYIVEPLGAVEDDPNVTDKKLPGNPTHSFRTAGPVEVVGEMTDWNPHPPEYLEQFRAGLEALCREGRAILYD
ncbi:NAD(+)--rifampin ADP-ribosyltransferase [Gordonia paraffinivorans]|uniref:NAD(+)--rifampin ADP-ribosyltransferase n=1 Tax=Gordonia paraffinivorans TaxID=175628 RepID=UPI0024319239|nr:NAD(+)--rifampin ADP-ribosyltransferase [Gordonia paraffinivorans]